ncbi:probable trypsin-like serine protease, partial [Thalassiosira pseudonana CCMP1335]
SRIIGGTVSSIGRYSYAVSLQDSQYNHFCGGSLIAPDVVLSAAHCGGVVATVAVQRHNLNDRTVGDDVTVKYEVLHPQHDPRSTDNDFSLIFLSRSTTADVDLVQLNKDKSVPMSGDDVTVMGWGDTVAFDSIQQLSDTLKEVEVTAISNAECESYQGQITDNMLCAEDNGEDSCQGDSGGPLVLASSDESGDVQVGVVSWGIGCANSSFPGVYSRVSA